MQSFDSRQAKRSTPTGVGVSLPVRGSGSKTHTPGWGATELVVAELAETHVVVRTRPRARYGVATVHE